MFILLLDEFQINIFYIKLILYHYKVIWELIYHYLIYLLIYSILLYEFPDNRFYYKLILYYTYYMYLLFKNYNIFTGNP